MVSPTVREHWEDRSAGIHKRVKGKYVTDNRIRKLGGLWRIVAVLTFGVATVVASASSASAYSAPARQSAPAVLTSAASVDVAGAGAVPAAAPVQPCPFEWFCAYPNPGFGGTPIKMFNCGVDVAIPWVGNGSWNNNQTRGTRARFKDINHRVIATTAGAPSADNSYNWTPVYFVQAC